MIKTGSKKREGREGEREGEIKRERDRRKRGREAKRRRKLELFSIKRDKTGS